MIFSKRKYSVYPENLTGIKFGSLAIKAEAAKLESANIISPATCNDVMHVVPLFAPSHYSIRGPIRGPVLWPSTMRAVHVASSALAHCLLFLINLQTHGFVQIF